jgi:hypothetical protein
VEVEVEVEDPALFFASLPPFIFFFFVFFVFFFVFFFIFFSFFFSFFRDFREDSSFVGGASFPAILGSTTTANPNVRMEEVISRARGSQNKGRSDVWRRALGCKFFPFRKACTLSPSCVTLCTMALTRAAMVGEWFAKWNAVARLSADMYVKVSSLDPGEDIVSKPLDRLPYRR